MLFSGKQLGEGPKFSISDASRVQPYSLEAHNARAASASSDEPDVLKGEISALNFTGGFNNTGVFNIDQMRSLDKSLDQTKNSLMISSPPSIFQND